MQRWIARLGGAVIAAAFLGPGTITTAATAGAAHGLQLLWALAFATLACFVLQEASARLTIVSGDTLGTALRRRFDGGVLGATVLAIVLGAILLGCAAYEAGNILGGVAGARLVLDLSPQLLTAICGLAAALLLAFGSTRQVVAVLSLLVAIMGVGFVVTAVAIAPSPASVVAGLGRMTMPAGSSLLVLGLVGTTVVPYNLFLGSGLAQGQDLRDSRWGLAVAILLGGLISMAVVVVGSAVSGDFSFPQLADVLRRELGGWSSNLFGLGLFAAGFSSAVTAPLAAALTARGLFSKPDQSKPGQGEAWSDGSWRYRAVWGSVLAAGVLCGLLDVQPIPAIIAAQAFNGVLLPLVAVFLFAVMNDRRQLGESTNGWLQNILLGAVVVVAVLLGMRGVLSAASRLFERPDWVAPWSIGGAALLVLCLAALLIVPQLRRSGAERSAGD